MKESITMEDIKDMINEIHMKFNEHIPKIHMNQKTFDVIKPHIEDYKFLNIVVNNNMQDNEGLIVGEKWLDSITYIK